MNVERVVIVVVDALRWDHSDRHRAVYPPGYWFRGTAPATFTPMSLASLFTGLRPGNHRTWGFQQADAGIGPHDTLFSVTDSIALSKLTGVEGCMVDPLPYLPDDGPGFSFHSHVPDPYWHGDGEPSPVEPESTDHVGILGDTELSYIHDWVVHSANPSDSSVESIPSWSPDDMDPKSVYNDAVLVSSKAHESILSDLDDSGLYENTLFVVVGDHGEALGERGEYGHVGVPPFDPVVRVPIGFCSTAFDTNESVVNETTNPGLIDVASTLVDVMETAGLRYDGLAHQFDGESVLTNTDGGEPGECWLNSDESRIRFSRTGTDDGNPVRQPYAVRDDRHTLLSDPTSGDGPTGYDGCVTDERAEKPVLYDALDRRCDDRTGAVDSPDDETIEMLEELGYR